MKASRISAAIVATLALVAARDARADTGTTVVLNTYSKVLVSGDARGPTRIGKDTGAGIMDAQFNWDHTTAALANAGTSVLLGTIYTRSADKPNNDNSYMQGGFALATLTKTGVTPGPVIDLPVLNGERAFMRPLIGFTDKYAILIAASEDNESNNGNPKPVMFIADKATGALMPITNNPRKNTANSKPIDLINLAVRQGIQVNNPDNQRGPHSIVQVTDTSFVVGMQYNNQAAEAFRVTVDPGGSVTMNWVSRYSNTAQHCRPQVAIEPGAAEGFVTSVEANNQPAEIGIRLTKFDVTTGKTVAGNSKIIVKSTPNQNKYVAEPSIGLLDGKVSIAYTLGSKARDRNGNNGHAGGAPVAMLDLFSQTDLSKVGDTLINSAQFSRHQHGFVTSYGPDGAPAVAVISGSSTGLGKGFQQIIPLSSTGALGLKDPAKVYTVSDYADVANVQARGKRNPNNQAKGFINGMGGVPNPGYTTDPAQAATNFMPETKVFTLSTVTGYSSADAAAKGIKDSLWLSLVPAQWRPGIVTTPGTATDKPGTNPDGTGPAPLSNAPGTNPSGDSAQDQGSVIPDGPGVSPDGNGRAQLGEDNGSCSVTRVGSSGAGAGFVALAALGIVAALRRSKREEA